MAFDIKKFLVKFVEEAREHINKLNEGLVNLEKNPSDSELINSVFRSAHTIKGSSRMMKLTQITEVAHKMEDVLGALREGKIKHSKGLANLIFKGLDAVSEMVECVAEEKEITADNTAVCEELAMAAEGNMPEVSTAQMVAPPEQAVKSPQEEEVERATDEQLKEAQEKKAPQETKTKTPETIRLKAQKLDELIKLIGELVSSHNRARQRFLDVKAVESEAKRLMELLSPGSEDASSAGARGLYMQLSRLAVGIKEDSAMEELLISELQEKALMLRMVPLSMVFDPLHRMVRDFSSALGKEVDFIVEGESIELDRKMIEKLGDPLVHMIRNSIDHGLETAEERMGGGKKAGGTIRLSANYDAGSVLIDIADDGAGISLPKIKDKALKRKLYSEEVLDEMSESELLNIIFQPGFSTSAIITDVSGRGVGMDVVRKNIVEELKGNIEIDTKEGRGTTFRLRLPLTLAIMRILLLNVSGMPFGINSHYVSEILRKQESEMISVVDKKAIRLREEFIPVVKLEALLNPSGNGGGGPKDLLIVILQLGNEKLGVAVDELLNEENVVIKTLPEHMKNLRMVSGVTISGRNDIINVLHVPAIFTASKEMKEAKPQRAAHRDERKTINILVVDDSVNTREIEKSILEAYGYSVNIADDGMDALEKAKDFKYDVVITDVEMPRMDGFSLTERLRKDESYRDTPIIIVTSREKEEDKRRGISVGANAYIVKGTFDQTNLLDTVQNLVG